MNKKKVIIQCVVAFCVIASVSILCIAFIANDKEKASWPEGVYFYQIDSVVDSLDNYGITVFCIACGDSIIKGLNDKTASLYLIDTSGNRYPVKYQSSAQVYHRYAVFRLDLSFSQEGSFTFNEAEIVYNGSTYHHDIGSIKIDRDLNRLDADIAYNIMFTMQDNSYCIDAFIENKSKHVIDFYGFSSDFNERRIIGYIAKNGTYVPSEYTYPLTIKSGETMYVSILLEKAEEDAFSAVYYFPGAILDIDGGGHTTYAATTFSSSEVLTSHSADEMKEYIAEYK